MRNSFHVLSYLSILFKGGVASFCALRRTTVASVRGTLAELPRLREPQGTHYEYTCFPNR
jgi:hypothetical protein